LNFANSVLESPFVIGTILNVAGILLGGVVGLARKKPLSAAQESFFKVMLGVLTVWFGLRLTWASINGPFLQCLKQVLIVIIALMLGRMTGGLLNLQKMSNRLGRRASERLAAAKPDDPHLSSEGFKACAALFCAAPLGILGSVEDGLTGYCFPLAIKAAMEGLATMGLTPFFGGGVMLAALPVLAMQGTITLICSQWLAPFLQSHNLLDSVNATGGLLVFSVALIILQLKKIPLTDYLPALIFAPLITWLLRTGEV